MKPFILFGGYMETYSGGWDDFIGDFNTLDEARSAAQGEAFTHLLEYKAGSERWYHIVDIRIGVKIEEGNPINAKPY